MCVSLLGSFWVPTHDRRRCLLEEKKNVDSFFSFLIKIWKNVVHILDFWLCASLHLVVFYCHFFTIFGQIKLENYYLWFSGWPFRKFLAYFLFLAIAILIMQSRRCRHIKETPARRPHRTYAILYTQIITFSQNGSKTRSKAGHKHTYNRIEFELIQGAAYVIS